MIQTTAKNKVIIGSRESRLAVLQSEMVRDYIKEQHPGLDVEILTMKTTGDKILDRTLDKVGGKARLAGKQIGQKPGAKLTTKKSIIAKEIIQKHNKSFGGSLNDAETIRQAGISRKTFYKYKKELLAYTVV